SLVLLLLTMVALVGFWGGWFWVRLSNRERLQERVHIDWQSTPYRAQTRGSVSCVLSIRVEQPLRVRDCALRTSRWLTHQWLQVAEQYTDPITGRVQEQCVSRSQAEFVLLPGRDYVLSFRCESLVVGHFPIYGIDLTCQYAWGLFVLEHRFHVPTQISVMPRLRKFAWVQQGRLRQIANFSSRGWVQPRSGLGSTFHDLREYQLGDSRRSIVWKHSLRHRKLLCRNMESETPLTTYVLLDVGQSMREGESGQRKIDYAVESSFGYIAHALQQQDRIGLISFDGEILEHLPAQSGPPQKKRIVRHLQSLTHLYTPAFSHMSLAELAQRVAQFLFEEGLLASAQGKAPANNYAMLKYLWRKIRFEACLEFPREWSSQEDLIEQVLRKICAVMQIELPYRYRQWATQKAQGLTEAIRTATQRARRTKNLLVWSDFGDIVQWDNIVNALQVARRKRISTTFLCPFPPWFSSAEQTQDASLSILHELLTLEQWTQNRRLQQILAPLGVSLLMVHPQDTPALLVHEMKRHRTIIRH
ncbi:MAG: DUF58 domain-containing protein, partial [Myxococcota bacterium]